MHDHNEPCPALPLAQSCPFPVLAADHDRCDTGDAWYSISGALLLLYRHNRDSTGGFRQRSQSICHPQRTLNGTHCWYPSSRLSADRHVWSCMLYCVVLCRTRRAQVIACSSLLHHDQRAWAADAAPNSEELVWANLG